MLALNLLLLLPSTQPVPTTICPTFRPSLNSFALLVPVTTSLTSSTESTQPTRSITVSYGDDVLIQTANLDFRRLAGNRFQYIEKIGMVIF